MLSFLEYDGEIFVHMDTATYVQRKIRQGIFMNTNVLRAECIAET